MGYPSFGPEAALELRILLYCMAYFFGGAALIGLGVYVVLVCSEMFFSQPHSKTQRAKVPHWAHRAPLAEESLDLLAARTPSLAESDRLKEEAVRVIAPAHGAQIPMQVPGNLGSEPTWL
jgi:hypothetical protein